MPAPSQTLKPGDTGSQVTVLQKALAALHFSPGKPDGDYGPSTQNAVERFQIAHNLGEDGIVGPATLAALQKALSGLDGQTGCLLSPFRSCGMRSSNRAPPGRGS